MLFFGVYLGVYLDLLNLNENLIDFLALDCWENGDLLVLVFAVDDDDELPEAFLLKAEKNFFNQFGRFVPVALSTGVNVEFALFLVLASVGISIFRGGIGLVVFCEAYLR